MVAQEQRRFGEAEQAYRQALDIFLEFDDRHSAAEHLSPARHGRAGAAAVRLRPSRHYRQALALNLEFDDQYSAASTYLQLGRLVLEQERVSDAVIWFVGAAVSWYSATREWAANAVEPLANCALVCRRRSSVGCWRRTCRRICAPACIRRSTRPRGDRANSPAGAVGVTRRVTRNPVHRCAYGSCWGSLSNW